MSIINDTIKFVIVWCLVITLLEHATSSNSRAPKGPASNNGISADATNSDVQLPYNVTIITSLAGPNNTNSSFRKIAFKDALCQPIQVQKSKPKRARVIYRIPAVDNSSISGCIDETRLLSFATSKNKSDGDLTVVIDLRQGVWNNGQWLKEGSPVNPARISVNVRLSVSPKGFTGRLTIVLHSQAPFQWYVDFSELPLASVKKRHRVVLTNKKSRFYSEQTNPDRFVELIYRPVEGWQNCRDVNTCQQFKQRLIDLGPLDYIVTIATHKSRSTVINQVIARIPPPPPKRPINPSIFGCHLARFARLSELVDASVDSTPEAGYSSCRSHRWEDSKAPDNLLQLLEFSKQFRGDNKEDQTKETIVQLTAPPITTQGSAKRIVVAIFSWLDFHVPVDIAKVHREIELVANQHVRFINPTADRLRLVNITYLRPEPSLKPTAHTAFLSALKRRLDGLSSEHWSVERLNLTLPNSKDGTHVYVPSLVTLRLHEAPLLLGELEVFVQSKCFDTNDLIVGLPFRPLMEFGFQQSEVLLGGNSLCPMYKNASNWLLRKVVINNQDNESCSRAIQVSTGYIFDWLTLQNNDSLPYRLPFKCAVTRRQDVPAEYVLMHPDMMWKVYHGATSRQHSNGGLHRFELEVFLDQEMRRPVLKEVIVPELSHREMPGVRLYARVRPTSQRVDAGLMIRDCVLTNKLSESQASYSRRKYIVHHGCEVGAYFLWEEVSSFRVKKFSFELPWPAFFRSDNNPNKPSKYYLHCFIQPCNFYELLEGLPRCWDQLHVCKFMKMPATSHLVAGPFIGIVNRSQETNEDEFGPSGNVNHTVVQGIPLWGAFLIASMAFLLGVMAACVLWAVNRVTRQQERAARPRPNEAERCRLLLLTANGQYQPTTSAGPSISHRPKQLPVVRNLWRTLVQKRQRRESLPLALSHGSGATVLATSTTITTNVSANNSSGSSQGSNGFSATIVTPLTAPILPTTEPTMI